MKTYKTKLKQCPFCGGKAVRGMFNVWCNTCNAQTDGNDTDVTEEQVITKWNTRYQEEKLLNHTIHLFDKKIREIAELLGVCYAGVDTDHDSIILAIKELQEDFDLLCRIEEIGGRAKK